MRQHFKVAHSHGFNDEEIPKQDCQKGKWQWLDERVFSIENDKTYDRDVGTHEDHDQWVEHDCFGDSIEFCVDCNDMGDFNKDDADDSQST